MDDGLPHEEVQRIPKMQPVAHLWVRTVPDGLYQTEREGSELEHRKAPLSEIVVPSNWVLISAP